jgi:hypothetical protein
MKIYLMYSFEFQMKMSQITARMCVFYDYEKRKFTVYLGIETFVGCLFHYFYSINFLPDAFASFTWFKRPIFA